MKQVEIILKSGKSVWTECFDIEMEWTKEGRLTWMNVENANPDIAFLDLDSVACVLVGQVRTERTGRKRAAEDAAEAVLQPVI